MKKYYFLVVSSILLGLSILAFSDNLITDVGQKSNSDPKFIIHGLFCFAWFIILVIQTNFIKKGNYKAHISFGVAGLIAAIGVFITTLYIFVVIFNGWSNMDPMVKANRFLILGFAILVTLAYLKRKSLPYHKRLMLVASFFMLGPILSRSFARTNLDSILISDLSWDITFLGTWSAFFISLFIYDWTIDKKFHPITYLGYIAFCIIYTISFYA
jgi:hypothetical protein|tara:strand:+ start:87960 stop:88601 length:642 start_codon:yes stop_codon:yes gene_type:complete